LLVLLLICPYVYKIWIGDELTIPFSLSAIIALYLIQQAFLAPFSQFLNGFGKLKLSLIILSVKIVLFVPLTWFLSSGYGAVGVVAAMLLIQLPSLVLEPMQVYRLIHHNAKGIWKQ
jgi:Na+-driven multidrug efflux pump